MRYTARRRNVIWKDDPAVAAARAALEELLCESNPHLFRHQLGPGEGIICNNVLHKRAGFTNAVDAPERVLYRARFFERVAAGPAAAVRGSERTPEVVRSQ